MRQCNSAPTFEVYSEPSQNQHLDDDDDDDDSASGSSGEVEEPTKVKDDRKYVYQLELFYFSLQK